ncbi:MAG: hypothetical protein A2X94_16845 [Bdellovibrionales bacterium GWB1_55_8]|nr:MAG: hypothetical protein A2X94_16845 [Bdellovibrionales bacterium GWB1_55_8]
MIGKKWFAITGTILLITAIAWGVQRAEAEESLDREVQPDPKPSPVPDPKQVKGKRGIEKETEGTNAPNRFEADTVIKSRYQLDGEPLEVDPD